MRIIAGRFRGRVLAAPRGLETRPTAARARTALFDALGPRVAGARVADLFAGTGALGLEALARGAAHVDFYESARAARDVLIQNIRALDVQAQTRIHAAPLPSGITAGGPPFDLILMDPPWRKGLELPLAERLVRTGRTAATTVLVVESPRDEPLDEPVWTRAGWSLMDTRRYGDTEMRWWTPLALPVTSSSQDPT
jgi:16S rRNA (guanine966-N2)-methyltransferase